jgi:hypothetical protein
MRSPLIELQLELLSFSLDPSSEARAKLDAHLRRPECALAIPDEVAAWKLAFQSAWFVVTNPDLPAEEAKAFVRSVLRAITWTTPEARDNQVVEGVYGEDGPYWLNNTVERARSEGDA